MLKREGLQGEAEFLAEVEVLSKVAHPNVVMLIGCCREAGSPCLVYERMANGSLQDALDCARGRAPLPWSARLSIAADVTRALCFLHGHPAQSIVHHDLKPSNVLLDDRFGAKLGDVGLARIAPPSPAGRPRPAAPPQPGPDAVLVGTWAYMDPEYRATGEVSAAGDVYALGITLLQLLTAMPPNGLRAVAAKAVEAGKPSALLDISDPRAGAWPLGLLRQLYALALRCTAERPERVGLDAVMQELLEVLPSTTTSPRGSGA